ncbi:MAG: glycine--tRNA ligase subunit beta [Alphaproteobacteria bacterium]|nr:glycine--tRNA ligase subunit beta [Alphaproteobacteria bacterium]
MADFLLELLSEEIPARMQVKAKDDLKSLVCKALNEAEITYGKVQTFATPRRLVLAIDGLATEQPDVDVERKGPRVGAPDKAIEGFKRSLGAESYELTEEDDKKGAFYVARFRRAGRPTADLLAEIIPDVLKDFPWPKSMRWSDHGVRWVRPLHGMLCLLDGATIPFTFGPVTSGNTSRGHRFHAPEPFEVESFSLFNKELARRFVVLDRDARRAGIKGQAELIAKQHGLRLREDAGLLDEVTGLVEWPIAVCGSIDAAFMDLPPEVLVTSMRAHQKYLALEDESGNLAAKFVAIANLEAKDGGEAIIAGNERVLRARLWDAKFFWDQDGRRPLGDLVPKLDDIVFHAKLGSVGQKVFRLDSQRIMLAPWIDGLNSEDAERAASLAKADLVTGMVGEFPELQGIMGCYYAKAHGESDAVAEAIGEHYAPQGPNDRCPSAPVSVALALADKLDTLAGFFNIGEKPTGSKDPFALRRAALGIIRLIIENRLRIPLKEAFRDSLLNHGGEKSKREAVVGELMTFVADRLKVHLRESGVRHDLISAVFATGDDDLVRLLARVEALAAFLASDDGANLLAGYRRANNIVRIEQKKDGLALDGNVDDALLQAVEERRLYDGLMSADHKIGRALEKENFADAMSALADLRRSIDSFFDKVIVNADDPDIRKNRLNLLSNIHRSIAKVADLSLIEDVVSNNDNRRVA